MVAVWVRESGFGYNLVEALMVIMMLRRAPGGATQDRSTALGIYPGTSITANHHSTS